jgi:hypothetical protein
MYMVASRTQQGAVGEGPDIGVLADLQLPADTWHAYGAAGGTATACGIPLTELRLFPDLTFLPVRWDDVCGICLAAVEG